MIQLRLTARCVLTSGPASSLIVLNGWTLSCVWNVVAVSVSVSVSSARIVHTQERSKQRISEHMVHYYWLYWPVQIPCSLLCIAKHQSQCLMLNKKNQHAHGSVEHFSKIKNRSDRRGNNSNTRYYVRISKKPRGKITQLGGSIEMAWRSYIHQITIRRWGNRLNVRIYTRLQ